MQQELKIGKIMKRLMEDQAETLASVAKSTGVPKSTISEWVNNRAPNPVQAAKVANHLGVSLHYLLFGQDDSMRKAGINIKNSTSVLDGLHTHGVVGGNVVDFRSNQEAGSR